MKKKLLVILLLVLSACVRHHDWENPSLNPCTGFRIRIGSMGKTEAGEQLVFLLNKHMTTSGFIITDQNEQAVLTGIVSFDNQGSHLTAKLISTTGKELWSGYIPPYFPSSLDFRAQDINKHIIKACTADWRK